MNLAINEIDPDDLQGSSALASFYSLQGLIDALQIFALILSTVGTTLQACRYLR